MKNRRLRARVRLLRRKLIRMRGGIASPRLGVILRFYANHRKWTLATLVVSTLLSLAIIYYIYLFYSPVKSDTSISLMAIGSKYEISKVDIYIEYSLKGEDIISTYVLFRPIETNLQGETFLINTSSDIHYSHQGTFHGCLKHTECYQGFSACYRFDDCREYSFGERFTGNIFGHGYQEEHLNFQLFVSKNAAVVSVPIDVYVSNTSEINIGDMWPEPTEKYVNGLKYSFDTAKNKWGIQTVRMNVVNRDTIYSSQFRLFLLGTLLGILSSMITTILLEFIHQYEQNRKSE